MTTDGIVIDEQTKMLTISRHYRAAAERVWTAWTDPDAIARWWGPHGWTTTVDLMDVRPGGQWRFSMVPDDGSADPVHIVATYREVVPRERLGYLDQFAAADWTVTGDGVPTDVTFTADGTGTRVAITAVFSDRDALQQAIALGMAEGYQEALARLDTDIDQTRTRKATTMNTLTSKDGTTIAYETAGSGPAVVVISTVAEDHTGVVGIATELAKDFTVVNFDRRGRGGSGDPQPYDPAREIEDIEALIGAVGGRAALISGSGGCVLALDAASALGSKVTALHLFEPPFIVSDTRPPAPAGYVEHQEALVAAGKRSEAVEYFMTEVVGVPAEWVAGMKQDPSWDEMAALAHTYAYDGRIMQGTQDGRPLPRDRWSIDAPVMVLVGENSEPFIVEGAHALAEILPQVTVEILPGQDHSAFWMAPDTVAQSVRTFLPR
ncbi:alpha/beta fold hydrolase [Jiangella gansuensis]|uniref:alpha/beta fold hydrolase n=1 Tax=Jiangella gansuensis TaxID=281473 RepID=UPI0004B501E1|nr:alpha/beta fold hydrolase [Jiangella gansuensis]